MHITWLRRSSRLHRLSGVLAIAGAMALPSPAQAAGQWIPLTHPAPFRPETALLLTDGTVLVHEYASENWWRLVPGDYGNYDTATWVQVTSMPAGYSPTYFASAVLPDGRVIVEGGEYIGGVVATSNGGAILDPVTWQWTSVAPPSAVRKPGVYISDAASVVLPDGRFMMALGTGFEQAILDPTTLTWFTTGLGKADSNDEEGWTLLPSGDVLTIDIGQNPGTELFHPATGTWTPSVLAGQWLVDPSVSEVGASILMADGRVFAVGALYNTALWTPGASYWLAGPAIPVAAEGTQIGADTPAALLPNGNVLFATALLNHLGTGIADHWLQGTHFYEFDGTGLTDVGRAGNAATAYAYDERFLLLPSGEVLVTDTTSAVYLYRPSGAPQSSWAPTITSTTAIRPGASTTFYGTQFNGLSQGVAYGDDAQAATNYPLVRFTSQRTNRVFYARTHSHSSMGVATGALPVSTVADIPPNVDLGPYYVQVVTNGIASSPAYGCLPQSATQACANNCLGAVVSDFCGGSITCPRLTAQACCAKVGGIWRSNLCIAQ